MVAGTSRNMTPPQAAAVHPKAMLARYPAVGPTKMKQPCCTNWRMAVRRPEPEMACAISTM